MDLTRLPCAPWWRPQFASCHWYLFAPLDLLQVIGYESEFANPAAAASLASSATPSASSTFPSPDAAAAGSSALSPSSLPLPAPHPVSVVTTSTARPIMRCGSCNVCYTATSQASVTQHTPNCQLKWALTYYDMLLPHLEPARQAVSGNAGASALPAAASASAAFSATASGPSMGHPGLVPHPRPPCLPPLYPQLPLLPH